MSKYRTDSEIMREILTACADGGLSYIKIMDRARLSFYQCKSYLHELMSVQLLAEDCKLYFTTPKGFEWLSHEERQIALLQNVTVAH